MQTARTTIAGRRLAIGPVLRAAFVAGSALFVCACQTDRVTTAEPDTPADYRLRHPITIREANRTFELFVGAGRGMLMPAQRAELLAFAQNWAHEATGGVVVDLPAHTANERSSAQTLPEIRSILGASGVPPRNIVVRRYSVPEHGVAPIRITYPKIAANAGPCGLWPEDIGPSSHRDYFENQPYWNLGCASQHNLAVMVDNPADLVQPRSDVPPAYTARRTTVIEQYRVGKPTGAQAPTGTNSPGKITDIGQ